MSLREQLRQNGMTLRRIEGDGNCLFRAFSDQIHGDQSLHKELRKKVTEFMKEQRDDFEPFVVDSDFDKHLRLLAQVRRSTSGHLCSSYYWGSEMGKGLVLEIFTVWG